MEQLKRGQAIVGLYEEIAAGKTFFTIEITTMKSEDIPSDLRGIETDVVVTEVYQLSRRTYSNLKRSLSRLTVERKAKTHDIGQHFMLDVALFIETWQAAAGCHHDPQYRRENEAAGGVGCPMCNAARAACDECYLDCDELAEISMTEVV